MIQVFWNISKTLVRNNWLNARVFYNTVIIIWFLEVVLTHFKCLLLSVFPRPFPTLRTEWSEFLQTFDIRFNVASSADESLLAMLGSVIAPIFKPLGFGDWRVSTALITGFTAKESVVSTLTVLLGGDVSQIHTLFTPFTALVFLVFTLLYTPCVAAIATVKREMGGTKAAFLTVVAQCTIAWVVAFVIHAIGYLF